MQVNGIQSLNFSSIKLKGKFSKYPKIKAAFINSAAYGFYESAKDEYTATLKTKSSKGYSWIGLEVSQKTDILTKLPALYGCYASGNNFSKVQEDLISRLL